MAKTVIAIMSSKLLAANMIIGIPFLVPRFPSIKIIIDGTNTAGDTAPKQNPFAKHKGQGISKMYLVTSATTDASTN
jgi:hypothetical protein